MHSWLLSRTARRIRKRPIVLSWNFETRIGKISSQLRTRFTISWFASTSLFCSIICMQVECFRDCQYFDALFHDKASFLNKWACFKRCLLLLETIAYNTFMITTMGSRTRYCQTTKSCTLFCWVMILSWIMLNMGIRYWSL